MNYLNDYNITNEQIGDIKKVFDKAEVNVDIFMYNEEKIKRILDIFKNLGIKNLYDIIITNPYMFYDTVSSIESKINGYKDKQELARLINEDPNNLDIVHLL